MDDERLTMSIKETAKRLGLGRNSVYSAIARGEIPVLKIGKRLLVPIYLLEKMLSGNQPGIKFRGDECDNGKE